MLKQEPASRGVGIPVLQGGEDVKNMTTTSRNIDVVTFDTTARVAPEKQDMPACLPLVSMTGCERAVMNEVQLNWEAAAADGHVLVNAPANRLAVFANTIGDVVLVAGDDESETVTTLDVQEAVRLVAMLRDAIDDAALEARRVADECAAFLRRNLRVVGALR